MQHRAKTGRMARIGACLTLISSMLVIVLLTPMTWEVGA